MSLIMLLITLVVVGVILYLINTLIPMDGKIKTIINVVVVLAVCIWLLGQFGLLSGSLATTKLHVGCNDNVMHESTIRNIGSRG